MPTAHLLTCIGGGKMFKNIQLQMTHWFALGLLLLTLAISSLSLAVNVNATDEFPLLETSSTQVDADAILACNSENGSGIC